MHSYFSKFLLIWFVGSSFLVVAQNSVLKQLDAIHSPRKKLDYLVNNGTLALVESKNQLLDLGVIARNLGKELGDKRGEVLALNFEGFYHRLIRSDNDSALIKHKQALDKLREMNDPDMKAQTYNNIGIVYKSKAQLGLHLEYLDSALLVARNAGLRALENRYLMNKTYLVFQSGKPQEAIAISLELIKKYNQSDELNDKSVACNNLGIFYRMTGKLDSAEYWCKESLKDGIFKKQPALFIADAYCELGYIEEVKRNYLKALQYVSKADSMYKAEDDLLGRYRVLMFKVNIGLREKKLDDALFAANGLVNLAIKSGNLYWHLEALNLMAEVEEKKGDLQRAIRYYKEYVLLKDSFNETSGKEKLNELAYKYASREKEKEMQLLRVENTLNSQKNLFTYLLSAVLVLLILSSSMYWIYKNKHKELLLARQRDELLFEIERQKEEIESKSRQLTSKTLYISERNELLEELLKITKNVGAKETTASGFQIIERKIKTSLANEKDWDEFKRYFEEINPEYFKSLKKLMPDLTEREIRLMAFVKIGLNTKEIANLLHIEPNSVKTARYRLKKKFNLKAEETLEDFAASIT